MWSSEHAAQSHWWQLNYQRTPRLLSMRVQIWVSHVLAEFFISKGVKIKIKRLRI